MNSTLQGIIIALLVGLLIGIVIAYFWNQGQVKHQRQVLEEQQRKLAALEKSHEQRLQETTERLRSDYEAALASTIEHYQDQLSARTSELQQTYDASLKVIQQGIVESAEQRVNAEKEKFAEPAPEVVPPTLPPQEVQRLKHQYELRLKEAAQKLQQAYEKQLSQYAKAVKADLQADFDKRLAKKIEHFDEQFAIRKAQLEKEHAERQAALTAAAPQAQDTLTQTLAFPPEEQTPSQIMGTGDETTVTLQPGVRPAPLPVQQEPVNQLSQAALDARVDARVRQATQQIRQEYEQLMASKLKEYREQASSQTRELKQTYQNKLNALATTQVEATKTESAVKQELDPFDLSDIGHGKKHKDKG